MPDPAELGDAVAILLDGLILSEESLRTSFVYNGQEYVCTGGAEIGGKRIDDGGFRMHAQLKIKVRTEVLGDEANWPREKQTILYKRNTAHAGRTMRIDAIINWYGAFLELHCNDPAEGM